MNSRIQSATVRLSLPETEGDAAVLQLDGPANKPATLDAALRLANDTCYGLSAGLWTSDLDTALRFSRGLRAGTVWVNTWMSGYPELAFGGYRQSGLGRELGLDAVREYCEPKTVQLHIGPRTTSWL